MSIDREKARQRTEFHLVPTVHESETSYLKPDLKPAHKFEVTLEPDDFTEEKYLLFEDYQTHVHHEPPPKTTRSGFRRFLCSSPLTRTQRPLPSGAPQHLGSWHQCYRVDGELVAFGVLDLLPACVSGVYFVYHRSVETWAFGKLAALREIALAREAHHRFYYMGYYIHGCAKMRYKVDYAPQFVLDLDALAWDPLDAAALAQMDRGGYVRASRDAKAPNGSGGERGGDDGGSAETGDAPRDRPPGTGKKAFDTPADAAAAVNAGLSLFDLDFPGMMAAADVEARVDLDSVRLGLRGGRVVTCDVSCAPHPPNVDGFGRRADAVLTIGANADVGRVG